MDFPTKKTLTEILSDFPDQSSLLPATLAHFTGPIGLNILVKGEIRVTPPGEFNDPFEFSPGVSEQSPTAQEWHAHFTNPNSFGRKADHILYDATGAPRSLEAIIKLVTEHPDIANLHIQSCREGLHQWFCTYFGAACFSDISPFCDTAVRHWAFYGAEHSGLAIIFNSQAELFRVWAQLRLLFKVKYKRKRPKCILSDLDEVSSPVQCLRRLRKWGEVKSTVWRPEQEWRWIRPLGEIRKPTGELVLPATQRVQVGDRIIYLHRLWDSAEEARALIAQVVVGCRATPALEDSARAACMHLGLSGDTVVRAKEHDSRFHLEPT